MKRESIVWTVVMLAGAMALLEGIGRRPEPVGWWSC